MKVTLNLYQPNFKAIELNNYEKRQVSSTLYALQDEDLPEFKKNLLKCDVMDVFYPHIKKESAKSRDPKAKSVDLNMKLFDAMTSFTDKKDPLGWFLSVLNGTEYKEPKPSLMEILEEKKRQEDEEYFRAKREIQYFPTSNDTCQRAANSINVTTYFYTDIKDKNYTKEDVINRAKELKKSPEMEQYPLKSLINLVNLNKYLIEYDNDEFELYIEDFSKAVDINKDLVKKAIIQKPKVIALSFDYINKHIQDISDIMGVHKNICKYEIFNTPKLIFSYPQTIKKNSDAQNFYKIVRSKYNGFEYPNFGATTARTYYLRTLNFLVGNTDKVPLYISTSDEDKLAEYLKNRKSETYHFILPEHKMTDSFINYATKFSEENLGENIFTFEVVSKEQYQAIEKPKSFAHYRTNI